MSIKKSLQQLFPNIKSWGWYGWVKYLMTGLFLFGAIRLTIFSVSQSFSEHDLWEITFLIPLFVLPMLSCAWLIIKDYRLPYIVCMIFGSMMLFHSVKVLGVYTDTFPDSLDIFDITLTALSLVCFLKITLDKKLNQKEDHSVLSSIAVCFITALGILIAIGSMIFPDDDDWKFRLEKECIETKVTKGYPRDFAREYCLGAGEGCVEKGYVENCEVGLKCCFATIEEDKKWNYLDYDEIGNKIEK